jgi:hypothetical protein
MDAAEGKQLAPHMGQSRPSRDFAQGSEEPHRFPDWDLAKMKMSGMKTQTEDTNNGDALGRVEDY